MIPNHIKNPLYKRYFSGSVILHLVGISIDNNFLIHPSLLRTAKETNLLLKLQPNEVLECFKAASLKLPIPHLHTNTMARELKVV